jgi:predicted ATPase
VGREEPLARIAARVAALREGGGHVVSVIGEAGLGKSRLLAEAAASGSAASATWLHGRSLAVGAELGFHPFRDLVRGAIGAREDEAPPATVKRLEAALVDLLGPDAAEVELPIAALLGVHGECDPASRAGADAMAKLVVGAISRLLRALAARRPLVIALDDLHWADASSLELLEGLLPLGLTERILFLLAFRPGFPETSGRLLAHARARYGDRHEEIRVEPLPKPAAHALIRQLTGGLDVSPSTCERIEGRGQPLPPGVDRPVAPRARGAGRRRTARGRRLAPRDGPGSDHGPDRSAAGAGEAAAPRGRGDR